MENLVPSILHILHILVDSALDFAKHYRRVFD